MTLQNGDSSNCMSQGYVYELVKISKEVRRVSVSGIIMLLILIANQAVYPNNREITMKEISSTMSPKRGKNGLRSNRKHIILMEPGFMPPIEPNELRNGKISIK